MFAFRSLALIVSIFGSAACAFSQETAPPALDKTLEWAQEVTLRPSIGGARSGTRRWMRPPTLSVMNASTQQSMVVVQAVKQINDVLAKTPLKGIVVSAPDNMKADILVYVTPLEKFPGIAKRLNFSIFNEEAPVGSWSLVNEKFETQRGYVMLASDKMEGDGLRSRALWAILGTLGFQNTSKIFPDSVFSSNAETMSDLDRKLIVFFYKHVPPMSEDRELGKLFKKHWPK